jgi:hypothetical protein
MFPDSGVPPGEAKNSILDPATVHCQELWYSTSRCTPRFDAAAANAMLAELINLINKGEVTYDCSYLNQVEIATRYLIQRGIPHGGQLTIGPAQYLLNLDPPLTRYNNYLTLSVVPTVNNSGPATVDVDGRGAVGILRNDGSQLVKNDLVVGRPVILIHYNGYFYLPHFAPSQIPVLQKGAVDLWVRTDGNDTTGDGSLNQADKAFRTIRGAWDSVANRFSTSLIYPINIRLGIPGEYEGFGMGPYGGPVYVYGNVSDRRNYKIMPVGDSVYGYTNVHAANMSLTVVGVNFIIDKSHPTFTWAVQADGGNLTLDNCEYEVHVDAPALTIFLMVAGGSMSMYNNHLIRGIGGVKQIGVIWYCATQSLFWGAGGSSPAFVTLSDLHCTRQAVIVSEVSVMRFALVTINPNNVTGVEYGVSANSIFAAQGQDVPGNLPGGVSSGGQFIP